MLLSEGKVPVKFKQRLATVKKQGARITEITMEDGTVYRGKMFIDTTYEGDLMARARVSYMVGREANSRFGETLNGIRAETPKHQFLVPVDPYLQPGDPSSGLLPFVMDQTLGQPGDGDRSVQTYNFRLCLTRNPENKLLINPPVGYDPKRYELLGRYFVALQKAEKKVGLGNFMKIDMVTPEKTDINNNGGFSTDYIGANHAYPEADYATRERIWQDHLNYTQGFITFLKTDNRVPESIRKEMSEWGLCKDEFLDTGGWPHAMYVRESRRMLSEYVMSEKVCRGVEQPDDAVGLGAYNMDSHNCRRIVRDGVAHNEGDVQVGVKPYPISYRSIVPKAGECENLFVPICLSATHIAYGSIRMEPVFMILCQSSATAAAMAIDANSSVQKVDYARLREQLFKDGQILPWTATSAPGGGVNPESPAPKLAGIVLDDTDAKLVGDWENGAFAGRVGQGYVHDGNAAKGQKSATWNPEIPADGRYEIIFHWVPNPNRASNVPVSITVGVDTVTVKVDEKEKSGARSLGRFTLGKGKSVAIGVKTEGTDGHVILDGVQLLKQ